MRTLTSPGVIHRVDSSTPVSSRLDSLTSLRFFAAFGVFVHHFNGFSAHGGVARIPWLYPFSIMGGNGVTFFFVLSGFLLTWVWKPSLNTRTFYWRRVGRIVPANLVATIPALITTYVLAGVAINWWSTGAAVLLIQTWIPGISPTLPGNPVTWTLSVEMLFYLLFPFLARWCFRLRARTLLLVAGLGLVAIWAVDWYTMANWDWKSNGWLMRNPVIYLPIFLLGMAMAVAMRRGWRLRVHPGLILVGFLALVPYYTIESTKHGFAYMQTEATVRQLVAVFSVLLIASCVTRDLDGRSGWLSWKPLVLLGAWSYCFYLVHQTVIYGFQHLFGTRHASNLNVGWLLLLFAVGTLAAWLLYTLVEEPARLWWDRVMPKSLRSARSTSRGQAQS